MSSNEIKLNNCLSCRWEPEWDWDAICGAGTCKAPLPFPLSATDEDAKLLYAWTCVDMGGDQKKINFVTTGTFFYEYPDGEIVTRCPAYQPK